MDNPFWLRGGIVQKVELASKTIALLTVRLPGRTIHLAAIGARDAVAIGEISDRTRDVLRASHLDSAGFSDSIAPVRKAATAETMRWRAAIEGARVLGLTWREGGDWARVTVRRGDEAHAVVANDAGLALVRGVDAGASDGVAPGVATVEDAVRLSVATEEAIARLLSRIRDERKQGLAAAIDRAIKKIARRIEAVEGDLASIAEADRWIVTATLLSTNAHRVPRGAREVTVDDWSTGEAVPVRIELDPARSAREHADALFHRARRLKRGLEVARGRLAEAQKTRVRWEALRAQAREAVDDDALSAVATRAGALGVPRPGAAGRRAKGEPPARLPYHVFHSCGRRILVGRGARDNDDLTTHVARPHDWWLHAKGVVGAHVVVPLDKGATIPADLLVDAAHLAAHFSDARGEATVEVQHVARRYVRKPRGAAVGSVVVEREKVLVLRVDSARVARLLTQRTEPLEGQRVVRRTSAPK